MNTIRVIAQTVLGITGTIQIVLGLLFWTGNAYSLIPVHIFSGFTLVLALWTLAVVALITGANRGLALVAIVWGVIVPVLGFSQSGLLQGSLHWIIEVIHLLVGMAAIGMGMRLARGIKAERTQPQLAS